MDLSTVFWPNELNVNIHLNLLHRPLGNKDQPTNIGAKEKKIYIKDIYVQDNDINDILKLK